MIYITVWIQYTNVTDRQTDTGRRLVPRLRIASRGKNSIYNSSCKCGHCLQRRTGYSRWCAILQCPAGDGKSGNLQFGQENCRRHIIFDRKSGEMKTGDWHDCVNRNYPLVNNCTLCYLVLHFRFCLILISLFLSNINSGWTGSQKVS